MNSSGKKIVRKVFYATGEAMAEVDKLKGSLADIARSFQAGYHLLDHGPSGTSKGNGKAQRPLGKQLDGLYNHLGRLIDENLRNKRLSYRFNPGNDELQRRAEELINDIAPQGPEKTVPQDSPAPVQAAVVPAPEKEIPSDEAITRLKQVVSLSRLNTPGSRQELLSHAKDPDSLVRRVIVNCLNPEAGQEEAFTLIKYINDPDEDVARIAIRKSAKTRNRLGFTYLIAQLANPNVKIRKSAIDALVLITGSDLGFDAAHSENARHEALLRWQQVWQSNQMNPQFLIDEEATRSIIKKKYIEKTVSQELKQGQKNEIPKNRNHPNGKDQQ